MFTIMYTTGNGYRCQCCRQSSGDFLDAESEDDAIKQCIAISRSYEGDFSIDAIRGCEIDDESELIHRINEAIKADEKAEERRKELAKLEDEIKAIKHWQGNLPLEAEKKARKLETLKQQLKEKQA